MLEWRPEQTTARTTLSAFSTIRSRARSFTINISKIAEQEGSQELASFFREVQVEDRKRSDRAKTLLAEHLTH